ncbi:MAG: FadR family transcriptional regulator [Bauldia sp.]|uniref:FadR/GntR family transcriptional regulator n=1 Tax=Bauldia sp. TaxID=2575872 RepID=UPI001D722CBF|nr:FadR/GntR family transcriptional regulator [Bauldia sp.]MCB1496252.1 FadR family transcriptional regulator [Bauldia sp.]
MTRRTAAAKIRAKPIIRPNRLSDRIVEAIRDDVEAGRVSPGDRLPTEAALSAAFDVSRTVIREAVSRLQTEGIVVSRRGSGVYVAKAGDAPRTFRMGPADTEEMVSLREIFELRIGVESEAAALAAARRSRSDVSSLRKILGRLSAGGRPLEIGVEADVAFHRRIAEISQNRQILRFVDFLSFVLAEAIRAARANSAKQEGWSGMAYGEHVAIFEAIETGDPEQARQAIRQHLIQAQTRLGLLQS